MDGVGASLLIDAPVLDETRPDQGKNRDRDAIFERVRGTEELLVARMAAGDEEAIGEVFDRYGGFVFGIARRVARSTPIAEDVVQEVLVSLWHHPERFDPGRGSLRAYLGVQAHRRAVDALRSDGRRKLREEQCVVPQSTSGPYGADEMDAATVAEVVRSALARLPDEQREAVELAFWKGHTYLEVAEQLGIPPGTAKSRLRLAQSKLRQWLAPLEMEPA